MKPTAFGFDGWQRQTLFSRCITQAERSIGREQKAGWGVMVSHRSGETEDNFIGDLVVGLCVGIARFFGDGSNVS